MPKVKQPDGIRIRNFIQQFGSDVLFSEMNDLKCKACNVNLNYSRKSNIASHLKTAKHIRNVDGSTPVTNQNTDNSFSSFNLDLCHALVSANIPIWKLENTEFNTFLEKYTGHVVPHESTIRKIYVDRHYLTTMEKIRQTVGDKKLWLSVDECTDASGRQIATAIIGTLEVDNESNIFLLNSTQLERTNSITIAQFITSSLSLLWPISIKYDKILLLVTDGAAYMKKTASSLKILYPNMLHITCLAHGLHRVAEEVRGQFQDVDKLISNVKKIFLKAPTRCDLFRDKAPDVPLPPQPVVTRWGTWINAALYYAEHLTSIQVFKQKILTYLILRYLMYLWPNMGQTIKHIYFILQINKGNNNFLIYPIIVIIFPCHLSVK